MALLVETQIRSSAEDASAERARLVRLCARLSGDADAAEDLAQETLLEAWRNAHKLRDPSGRWAWLSAIARNVCMRHGRVRDRDRAHLLAARPDGADPLSGEREPAGGVDLEIDLERGELADLLDRAMALLPPETRAVLVERYVRDTPQAEAAAKLDLSEGALAIRLHRGSSPSRGSCRRTCPTRPRRTGCCRRGSAWRETRIWCVVCGSRRLLGRWDRAAGELTLRCPICNPHYLREPSTNMAHLRSPRVLGGVKGYRPGLMRIMDHAYAALAPALDSGAASCLRCGARTVLRVGVPDYVPPPHWTAYGVHLRCDACADLADCCLAGIALWTPEGRRFWARHPRLRLLPEREIDADGRAAVVTTYESVDDGQTFSVVSDCATMRPLAVHGGAGQG